MINFIQNGTIKSSRDHHESCKLYCHNALIELTELDDSYFDETERKMILNMPDYLEFVQIAKQANILDDMLEKLSLECANCKAFMITTSALYKAIENVMDYVDSDTFVSESDSWGRAYDSLWELKNHLTETISLTDEEWRDFYITGTKHTNILYDSTGALVTDSEGNPIRFVYDEVIFKFDDKCECSAIINRL